MEALNALDSRKLTPAESMMRLEKAILLADQRSRIRRDITGRAAVYMGVLCITPVAMYMIYHLFHPSGVMQNHKSSSGAYLNFTQTFLYRWQPFRQQWRPEFYWKESQQSLHVYAKKIENAKKEDPEKFTGVNYPSTWH